MRAQRAASEASGGLVPSEQHRNPAEPHELETELAREWSPRAERMAQRLEARGREVWRSGQGQVVLDRRELADLPERCSEWHAQRAASLRRPLDEKLAQCGQTWARFACGCADTWGPVGCRQTGACAGCRRRWWTRKRKQVVESLEHCHRQAQATWERGRRYRAARPRLVLLTGTIASTGTLERDREVLVRAWARLRAHYAKWSRGRSCYPRSFPFVLVWELTHRAGVPHLHWHAVAVVPFLPLPRWARLWPAWTDGAGEPQGLDWQTREWSSASCAAGYVGKYLTKGVEHLPAPLAAEYLEVQYGRARCSGSRWMMAPTVTYCTECGCCLDLRAQRNVADVPEWAWDRDRAPPPWVVEPVRDAYRIAWQPQD